MRISLLFSVVLLGLTVLSGNAQASSGHIYLLRGLANVFSTGLDVLDERLVQRGFAATVHNHSDSKPSPQRRPVYKKAAKVRLLLSDIRLEQTLQFLWPKK